MNDSVLQGPVRVQIQIYIMNRREAAGAVVTIGMDRGKYPTEKQIRQRVQRYEREQMAEGFELCSRAEFVRQVLRESGIDQGLVDAAFTGDGEWDD